MGRGTHEEVWDGTGTFGEVWDGTGTVRDVRDVLRDRRGGPQRVVGPSWRSGTRRRPSVMCGTFWGTRREVWNGSWNIWSDSGRVKGPSGKPEMDWGTLEEVRDKVGGPLLRSGTGKVTLREVREGSGIPQGGPGRVWGPSGRSRMSRSTPEDVRNGLEVPRGGSGTGLWTFGEVQDGSGDSQGSPSRV